MELVIRPVRSLKGTVAVPGDKSISHRALMLGAIATGETVVENFLEGEDCLATLACFRSMGVEITGPEAGRVVIRGCGLYGLSEPEDVLDAKNSGTTMRLLLGILAGQPFFSVLTGDSSLRRRPMGRVVRPLREMGARISGRGGGELAPLAVTGGELKPLAFTSPVASAQVKSAVLLAGLYAQGTTSVTEPALSRDHTERMLEYFGARVTRDGLTVAVDGNPVLKGAAIRVPGDISSAAFLMVAACIVPEAALTIKGVGLNPTRTGIIEVLREMGARMEITPAGEAGGEPYGDITVYSSELRGVEIGGALIPRLIDEIPVITVAAACACGKTVIRNAAELKVKESDRLKTMAAGLSCLGVPVEELPDGLIIYGGKRLSGAVVESYGDHRVAMALAVAGLTADGETVIKEADVVNVSFPDFVETLQRLSVE
ncbi:MAG: 3-phosphoshikimate 1-carboxyvinyltransferase [Bacillota bacterium]|nr:3-phosphoshikimate 1-carboxyvinyltransferase [Thermoanaerobacteraceae bacterium]